MDDDKQTQINDQNYKTDHALISEKRMTNENTAKTTSH